MYVAPDLDQKVHCCGVDSVCNVDTLANASMGGSVVTRKEEASRVLLEDAAALAAASAAVFPVEMGSEALV